MGLNNHVINLKGFNLINKKILYKSSNYTLNKSFIFNSNIIF